MAFGMSYDPRPRVNQKTNPQGFTNFYQGIEQPSGPIAGLNNAMDDPFGREIAKYAPASVGYQSGADREAASQNQQMAGAIHPNMNSVAGPQWERYFGVMNARGASTGGHMSNFNAGGPAEPSHEQYANYAQNAMRGLQQANPFPSTGVRLPPRHI